MGGYEVKLPDGTILKFNTAAARDKYKALVDMFTVDHLGDVPHTNMELGVRLSEDNPLKDGVIKPLGISIDLKTISNRDWEEKYKGQGSGYTKKVVAVDPYSTPTPKQKTQEVPTTAPLQAVPGGTPYSSAQAQPQNARYEEAAYKQNQLNALVTPVNSPCDVCAGVAVQWGAEVYKCADGTGPYYFSNITIDGGQQAGPFMVGKSYKCNPSYGSQPGGDCHIGSCWGPIWHVTQIIPTGQSGPGTINTQAQSHMCVDLIEDCNCVSYPYNCGGCSQPHTASQSYSLLNVSQSAQGCEAVQMYFTNGSGGWDVNRGAFLTYDTVNAPGVGIQLMDEQSLYNMVNTFAQLAPYNYGPVFKLYSGSVAKVGNKIYGWVQVSPASNPAGIVNELLELEIDAALTTVSVTNIYARVGSALSALAGNSFCAKNSNTLLTIKQGSGGGSDEVHEIIIDPATNSFTNTALFTPVAQTGGDLVYDSATDTIWHGEQDSVIRHYDMNGNVLGVVVTNGIVWRMWCQGGEIIYYTATGGTSQVDKANYTAISLFITFPLQTIYPGDAASSPDCCVASVQPPSNCAPPHTII